MLLDQRNQFCFINENAVHSTDKFSAAEKDEELQQQVNEVMEQFERDTELIFRKFYQKCGQSGYHIERDQFMSLVTERYPHFVT